MVFKTVNQTTISHAYSWNCRSGHITTTKCDGANSAAAKKTVQDMVAKNKTDEQKIAMKG